MYHISFVFIHLSRILYNTRLAIIAIYCVRIIIIIETEIELFGLGMHAVS